MYGGINQFSFMGMSGMYGMNSWGGFPGVWGGFGGMRRFSQMFSPMGNYSNSYSQSSGPGSYAQSGSSSYVPNLQIGETGYGREQSWSRSGSASGNAGFFGGNYNRSEAAAYSDTMYQYDKQKAVDYKFETQLGRRDPVILDLNGDGKLDVTGAGGDKINYDVNGDGITDRTEWMKKGSQDGLLVYDNNKDGKITGNELMNETSIDGKANTYKSGWEKALALGDKNKDGKLTGEELNSFSVWVDKNGDGKTDEGELQAAGQMGIVDIDSKEGSFTRRQQIAHESGSYSKSYSGSYDMFGNRTTNSSEASAYSRSNPWGSYSSSSSNSYSGGSDMFGNNYGTRRGAQAESWNNPFGSYSYANSGGANHMNGWWY